MPEQIHQTPGHEPLNASDLAFERTAMGQERTLMAWVRTAISMISFGFTIYKFFQGSHESAGGAVRLLSPRLVGMVMISFGLFSLVLAMIQNYAVVKKLRRSYPDTPQSFSVLLAAGILIFGMVLFLGALFRQ
jgi:putative membrane protein